MKEKSIVVKPDPKRVIEGLRDTGYKFESAIADIVDNSLGAEATVVKIKVDVELDGCISVFIADNGKGMNEDDLINAMRYGSQARSCALSLCKFGLGLKTASTAFCRKLSVVSKDKTSENYWKATWDLDHVSEVRDWEVLLPEVNVEEIDRLKQVAGEGSGTLIIWEKVDRLIKINGAQNGRQTQQAVFNIVKKIKEMLPMIYQRFLDPKYPNTPKIKIFVNDEELEAWDPFVPDESQIVGNEKIELQNPKDEKNTASIEVIAYVLPRREAFKSQDLAKKARIRNDYQGIYVYRENRLIYGPDWFNIYTKEPHSTLLRVSFSFNHELDDAFHIDIKKSQVIPAPDLMEWIEKFLQSPRRAAAQVYRQGMKRKITDLAKSIHSSSNQSIASKAADVVESTVLKIDEGKVEVTNREGISRIRLKVSDPATPDEIYVKPVDSIEDGLLWEPIVMNNKVAVAINTGHDYYSKVYIPNKNSDVIIQGLDSLLWALSEAEMETINEQNQKYFLEMRYHLSKILRILVRDLPDPPETEE
jgi:hypothetical protein